MATWSDMETLERERMSRLDGCPECCARNNAPTLTEPTPHGVQCRYVCRDCGGTWTTAWWEEGTINA